MRPEPAPESRIDGYPVAIEVPVWWGDQDAFGHVNNTVPLRWFESARIEYMGRAGLSAMMATLRIGPILASITADYRRQVHFPDSMIVGARVTRIGRTSLSMEHVAVSRKHAAVAVEGRSTLVVFHYGENRPEPIPPELRKAIASLEGREFPLPG